MTDLPLFSTIKADLYIGLKYPKYLPGEVTKASVDVYGSTVEVAYYCQDGTYQFDLKEARINRNDPSSKDLVSFIKHEFPLEDNQSEVLTINGHKAYYMEHGPNYEGEGNILSIYWQNNKTFFGIQTFSTCNNLNKEKLITIAKSV